MARYNTVFHTLAKILPRHEIDRLDKKYGQGDRRRKTSRYVQLIVMLMAQILGLKSLREIEQAQKSKQKRLYHLGVKSPISRSALSRMNAVMTQVWVALCLYLILAFIRFISKTVHSMREILNWIRINLFSNEILDDYLIPKMTEPIVNPKLALF
ncbi:MAG: DUF4372 domain-containing protein [Proteobacteria bacterium]|nr:DUF4372 domain-containing protein [Pseudomonadota bacterium]